MELNSADTTTLDALIDALLLHASQQFESETSSEKRNIITDDFKENDY